MANLGINLKRKEYTKKLLIYRFTVNMKVLDIWTENRVCLVWVLFPAAFFFFFYPAGIKIPFYVLTWVLHCVVFNLFFNLNGCSTWLATHRQKNIRALCRHHTFVSFFPLKLFHFCPLRLNVWHRTQHVKGLTTTERIGFSQLLLTFFTFPTLKMFLKYGKLD